MNFEDFEFKPLTDGLGFHKKNSKANGKTDSKADDFELPPLEPRSNLASTLESLNKKSSLYKLDTPEFNDPLASAPKVEPTRLDVPVETKNELPEIAPSIDVASSGLFSKPLPRTEADVPKKSEAPIEIPRFNPRFGRPLANPAIRDQNIQNAGILSVLDKKENVAAEVKPNKVEAVAEVKYIESAPASLALFLDLTVIAGLSILFMLGLVVATSTDIVPILSNIANDIGAQIAIALLVYSVSQLYLILSRSFFGQTLGEWSMDMQLGQPQEQEKLSYVFKLISRTLILLLTGFIVLPLISMILGKDIAGRATGLKLYNK